MMRRWSVLIAQVIAWFGTALVVLGALLHLTIRDRSLKFSPFFYALPWPVLAALALGLGIFWLLVRARGIGRAHLVAAVVFLGCWLVRDWEWSRPPAGRGDLRVVQWNVDRPDVEVARVTNWLRAQDADVIGVSEWSLQNNETREWWRAAFPDYQPVTSPGEMLCLVRGEVLSAEKNLLRDDSYVTLIRARVRGRELHLLQTDIYALPSHYRGTALRRLGEIARASADAPVILLGDFNTPRNSHFFQDWRAGGLRNAFEAAGHGYAATWPSPLPVLSLDQIWFNSHLRAVRSEHVTSWSSDHRAVVAEFDFVP